MGKMCVGVFATNVGTLTRTFCPLKKRKKGEKEKERKREGKKKGERNKKRKRTQDKEKKGQGTDDATKRVNMQKRWGRMAKGGIKKGGGEKMKE